MFVKVVIVAQKKTLRSIRLMRKLKRRKKIAMAKSTLKSWKHLP